MSLFLMCDGPECRSHIAATFAAETQSWLELRWTGDAGDPAHFCSEDCAMRRFAKVPPPQVVAL